MAKSIFETTFADEAPVMMINIKTLATLGYAVTIRFENARYSVNLVHSGKRRKRFTSSVLENALDSAMHYAREYDAHIRGEQD